MAIQQSDLIDFGNGIIGDDTFDVWRKKTNSIKNSVDALDASLTSKINTDVSNLSTVYIPQSGSATAVSTSLAFSNPITFNSNLNIGGSLLFSQSDTLKTDKEFDSSVQLTSTKVRAKNNLILGDKTYNVPSSPAINNAVLVAQTNGALSWANVNDIFSASGGFTQTTTVFEEVMPVGSVVPLAGATNDTNFLLCEGATISKAAYPDLFDVIGYDYGGSGDNFKLPNYKGRVLVGAGTDSAGSVSFSGNIGVFGGTNNRSTGDVNLTIDQMPPHRHWSPWVADDDLVNSNSRSAYKSSPLFGADASDNNFTNHVHFDADSIDNDAVNTDFYAYTTYAGGEAGDASLIGLTDVTNAQYTGGSSSSGGAHSHNLTANERVQPYVTIKWYIKAKKNSKIDFKINIANSGLESATAGGQGQTLISPVDETITLKAKVDDSCLRLLNGEISIKHSPQISGSIKTTGPDIDLDNPDRRGGFTNDSNIDRRRMIVHGGGSHSSDPNLNGYDRKTVETLADRFGPNGQNIPTVANNDTLIINYDSVSPNSVGDYANGVIINGVNTLMFQDGSVIKTGSVPKKGVVKKLSARQSGYSGVSSRGRIAFINDDDQPVINGFSDNYTVAAPLHDHTYGYREHYLPDDEEAQEIHLGKYHTSVVTKSGKIYGDGWGNIFGNVEEYEADSEYAEWCRAMCEDDSVKFGGTEWQAAYDAGTTDIKAGVKIPQSWDSRVSCGLDTNGLLWVSYDGNGETHGLLARGIKNDIQSEIQGGANVALSQKRETLANTKFGYNLANNRINVPHIVNPVKDSGGNRVFFANFSDAVDFDVLFKDAVCYGGNAQSGIMALGTDGKVYTIGDNGLGQCGNGTSTDATTWQTVIKVGDDAPLTDVIEIYSKGYGGSNFAKTSNGDIWAWGDNNLYQLGLGDTLSRFRANKIWDASDRGAGGTIYSNGASGTSGGALGSEVFIVTDHADPQLWGAGKSNHYGFGQDGDIEDVIYTSWKQVTTGPWNSTTHKVINFYNNGSWDGHSDQNYTIAENKSTGKRELWVTGYGGQGSLGITYSTQNQYTVDDAGGYGGSTVKWERIRHINDKFLRKVIDLRRTEHSNGANLGESEWANTIIHLNDGRIFGVGRFVYGSGIDPYGDDYLAKFNEIKISAL